VRSQKAPVEQVAEFIVAGNCFLLGKRSTADGRSGSSRVCHTLSLAALTTHHATTSLPVSDSPRASLGVIWHWEKKCPRSERVEHYTPRTHPTFSLDYARAPFVEQRWNADTSQKACTTQIQVRRPWEAGKVIYARCTACEGSHRSDRAF
jgi:hypothetical protein